AQRLSRAFNHVGQNSMKICSSSGSVLCGHQQESVFDTSKAPWQALGALIKARNGMIHFKPSYKAVSVDKGVSVTSLSRLLSNELVSNLPVALRGMIEALYRAYDLPAPPWLQEQPGWSLAPRSA
ncbi:UNVERIFIED_ORG: hypothetical protein J2791_006564, partial [Burkholderia contaminans]|nr:hypothetical protein [Burkholderia contaminans]